MWLRNYKSSPPKSTLKNKSNHFPPPSSHSNVVDFLKLMSKDIDKNIQQIML